MIALIDYKAGNLTSVKKALATLGADVVVPAAPGDLAEVRGIIEHTKRGLAVLEEALCAAR